MDPSDFSSARELAMRLYSPVTFRQQQIWLDDWKAAMERMHYLQVKHAGLSDSLRSILRLRGALKKPNLNLEMVRPDVETLWEKTCCRTQEAAHSFRNTDDGFECSFFAVQDNSYITGLVSICRCTNP